MAVIDLIKDYVSNKVFQRGKRYYNTGKVVNYNLVQTEPKKYRIKARVIGTYSYIVKINLEISNKDLYFDGYCNCPYDWGDICKHQVAVLHKFCNEDYSKLTKQGRGINKDFKFLEKLSKLTRPVDKTSLKYYIKGFMTDSMVNFKLILKSEQLTSEEIERIISYIHSSNSNPVYANRFDFDLLFADNYEESIPIKNRLKNNDLANIEYLSKAETSKSRTDCAILFPKNSGNFDFLLNLIENNEVYLEETGNQASTGEILYPEVVVKGDEDKLKLEIKEDYPVYQTDFLAWTVLDSTIHPLESENFSGLPDQINVPKDKKGKLLFEILPTLQKNISLKIDENLTDYELIEKKPKISLKLDYKNKAVFCYSSVEIENKVFESTEILGINLNNKHYEQIDSDAKLWSCWDTESIQEFIDFLEDFEFHVRKDSFVIRDKNDIQEFITDGFIHLPEEWEVTTTKAFDEVEVKSVELEPIIEFEEPEDDSINWFEFTVTYNLGGKTYSHKELINLLKYNKRGERYINIGNQYFIIEETEQEKSVEDALKLAQEEDENVYRSNYYNLLYYRNLVKEHGIKFEGNKVYNQLEEDITGDNLVKKIDIPDKIGDKLRDYQKRGFYWLRFLAKYNFGGILADDMGLGKTVQTLTFLKSISQEIVEGSPALIICPRTLIYNWGEEIQKFFPDTDYLIYYGTPEEREGMLENLVQHEMIITSYSIASRDYEQLNEFEFSYCIIDEAQHIKNHKTKRAKAVKSIIARNRLALTGTPIENSVKELWSIFDFLMKGYLGNNNQFNRNYFTPIKKNNNQQKLIELKKRVAPFILRRRKQDVLQELPEKIVNIHSVEMTKLQEDTYRTILDELKTNLEKTVKEQGFNRSRINVLAVLTKLRQVCNHPRLVLDDVDKKMNSGKMESLLEIVQDAIDGGHKIVVFSQFVQMLKLIRRQFKKNDISFEYLDGSTRNRMERVNHFNNEKDISTFLISLKAGGTGLNLTSADIVIHVDPWWNPMVERQATDRTHRIGQENKVIVYKLITTGTVEEKMIKLQQKKKNIFENVIENNVNPMNDITWEDIQELLRYE